MDIRPARPEDWPRLQEIERLAGAMFLDVGMPEIAADDPPSAEELESAELVFVAVDRDQQAIGYARIEIVDGHAHLEQLSVVPEQGRKGVGSALLDSGAAWARARGDREITLTTFRDVAFNAPFYAHRGYAEIPEGERGPELVELVQAEADHGLDPARRVAMRRDLS